MPEDEWERVSVSATSLALANSVGSMCSRSRPEDEVGRRVKGCNIAETLARAV
jgi:hypothetical protein